MRPAELSRRAPVMRLVLALGGLAVATACGGGEDIQVITEMPTPNRDSAQLAEAATTADEPEETGSSRTEIVRTEFTTGSRDPFTAPRVQTTAGGGVAIDEIECDTALEPLGETDVNSLRLIGLVTGTAVPRAMFANLDARGRAIIVSEGAKIGPRCSSFISEIRDNQIVVTQRSADAETRTETIIQLNRISVTAEVTEAQ